MEIPSKIGLEEFRIPSILDGEWDFPWQILSTDVPKPLCISKNCVDYIKIEIPDIPKISINWGEPPQISCVILVQSPGTTYQENLDAKERGGMHISTEEKCEAILRKIVEIINKGEPVTFEEDWGDWTATIIKGKMHSHVGVDSGNFEIFVNNLYDLLIKNTGLSWV